MKAGEGEGKDTGVREMEGDSLLRERQASSRIYGGPKALLLLVPSLRDESIDVGLKKP